MNNEELIKELDGMMLIGIKISSILKVLKDSCTQNHYSIQEMVLEDAIKENSLINKIDNLSLIAEK